MVSVFDHVGFGQWFRYVTGAIEVCCAVLLLTGRYAGLGGVLLSCTMIGAIISHLTVVPGSPVPALILLLLSATIAFVYRGRTIALVGAGSPRRV